MRANLCDFTIITTFAIDNFWPIWMIWRFDFVRAAILSVKMRDRVFMVPFRGFNAKTFTIPII